MKREPSLRPLGALEDRVMEILWDAGPLPVRDVTRRLGGRLAYTTVMTTLDRLFKKGLLSRAKDGNAFVYQASFDREEYHRRVVEHAVSGLLSRSSESVLAGFIDAVAVDEKNLSRLERLLAAKRKGR